MLKLKNMRIVFNSPCNHKYFQPFLNLINYLNIWIQFIQQKKMIKEAVNCLRKSGYAVLPDFISPQTCDKAIKQIDRLIEGFNPTKDQLVIFSTGSKGVQKTRSQDYFLNSSDNVSFFFEEKAYVDGKLVVPKLQSINKIGHALHQHNNLFKKITFQSQVGQICKQIPIKTPVVVQSMAILKPPTIGGHVSIHQDSTFLYDQPETLVGFWIPLQDATVKNGCLWGIPGSHKFPLYSRSKMDWKSKSSYTEISHAVDYKESDFIPLQMKRGSLAIFTGRFLHKSHENTSNISRYAYTWHLKSNDTKWATDNWLQRKSFPLFQFNYNDKETK